MSGLKRRAHFWTDVRVARLRRLAAEGLTRRQAATLLDCSPAAIAGAAFRYNVSFAPEVELPDPADQLAREIEAAHREAPDAPPYRASVGWPG